MAYVISSTNNHTNEDPSGWALLITADRHVSLVYAVRASALRRSGSNSRSETEGTEATHRSHLGGGFIDGNEADSGKARAGWRTVVDASSQIVDGEWIQVPQ